MTLPTSCPKPQPISELEKRTARIAQLKKLERSRKRPIPRSVSGVKPSGKRPKARNAKRAKANHERAYGDHASYVRQQPCAVCGFSGTQSDAAHTTTGGVSRKADASTLAPLCKPHWVTSRSGQSKMVEGCHRECHRIGVQTFERKYRVDLKAIAAALWAEREATA